MILTITITGVLILVSLNSNRSASENSVSSSSVDIINLGEVVSNNSVSEDIVSDTVSEDAVIEDAGIEDAGIKDSVIKVYNINKKKLLTSIPTKNSTIILSSVNDDFLYYLESTGDNKYTIFQNSTTDKEIMVLSPTVKTIELPKNSSPIVSGKKLGNQIILTAKEVRQTPLTAPLNERTFSVWHL